MRRSLILSISWLAVLAAPLPAANVAVVGKVRSMAQASNAALPVKPLRPVGDTSLLPSNPAISRGNLASPSVTPLLREADATAKPLSAIARAGAALPGAAASLAALAPAKASRDPLPPVTLAGGEIMLRAKVGGFAALQKRVADSVRWNWGLPVAELLADSDVLAFGETHHSLDSIHTLSRAIPEFKAAGVTHIGLEMLKVPEQARVNRFLARKTAKLAVHAMNLTLPRGRAFLELFWAAREAGLKIIALDRPLSYWGKLVARLAAQKTGFHENYFGQNPMGQLLEATRGYTPGFNEAVYEVLIAQRNRFMAATLAAQLPAGAKAVTLTGEVHLAVPEELEYQSRGKSMSPYGSMARELAGASLRAFSILLTGGLFTSLHNAAGHRAVLEPVYRIAEWISPQGNSVFVPTSDRTAVYHMGDPAEPSSIEGWLGSKK